MIGSLVLCIRKKRYSKAPRKPNFWTLSAALWCHETPKWGDCGPTRASKTDRGHSKTCSKGVPRRRLKSMPFPGPGKSRFCYYLLHFSEAGHPQKDLVLGVLLGCKVDPRSCKEGLTEPPKQQARLAIQRKLLVRPCLTRFVDILPLSCGMIGSLVLPRPGFGVLWGGASRSFSEPREADFSYFVCPFFGPWRSL